MSATVGDYLLERLSGWNIRRVSGSPGDGINGLMGALDRAGDRFDYVRVRHEEMAAFMACAHAKFTGEVGVCLNPARARRVSVQCLRVRHTLGNEPRLPGTIDDPGRALPAPRGGGNLAPSHATRRRRPWTSRS